jgi:hypothetical protein
MPPLSKNLPENTIVQMRYGDLQNVLKSILKPSKWVTLEEALDICRVKKASFTKLVAEHRIQPNRRGQGKKDNACHKPTKKQRCIYDPRP